jgi:hypothetical protein
MHGGFERCAYRIYVYEGFHPLTLETHEDIVKISILKLPSLELVVSQEKEGILQ